MAFEYSPDVVADLTARVTAGLALWNLPPNTEVRLLNLSENATFLLRSPAGEHDVVLRLHRVGYSSRSEIRSELAWIEALRQAQVIETAAPIVGMDGEFVQTLPATNGYPARQAVAFARVAGKEPDGTDDLPAWFEHLGEITAKMHRHAKAWNLPAAFRRKMWDFDAMVGPDAFWGPWRKGIGLDAAGAAKIERALLPIAEKLERFGKGPQRFGLVHADLRLANLLVDGPHLRIIDFDDCGFSWFIYDFAASVSFIEHEAILPELLHAWVTGYRKVAPLTQEETAMLPIFVVLRRILLTAWLASHNEIPFAREMGANFTAGTVDLAERLVAGSFLPGAATL
jgi:Ser/Thr protein kinase RdoA (MazF antagonist)